MHTWKICLNPEPAHFTIEHKNIFYFIFYISIKTISYWSHIFPTLEANFASHKYTCVAPLNYFFYSSEFISLHKQYSRTNIIDGG